MLMSRPRILLLDEPTAGLDGPLAERVLAYVFRVQAHFKIPAVLCSHDHSLVADAADEVITIRDSALQRL